MSSGDEPRPDLASDPGVDVVPDRDPADLAAPDGPAYAAWGQRVVAAIFDNAILAGVTWLAVGAGFLQPTLTPVFGPVFGSAAEKGWISDPLILVPIGAMVTLLVLQARTGWTPGKLVVGIRVVREVSAVPAGLWKTLVRWALHLLDAILLIGYLRPLWHERLQTFADGIAHTVVVQELPDLPRRPRTVLYSAALVACVLGLGYGCVPINGSSGSQVVGSGSCEIDGPGPVLTSGVIALNGSVSVDWDRRMWTVRETRTAYPGATVSWTSDPSVRGDVDYRIELDTRPYPAGRAQTVSWSWDVGIDGDESWSDDGELSDTRTTSPDGDLHVVHVETTDSDGGVRELGTEQWIDVRLLADGELVAECGGALSHPVRTG